MAKLNLHESSPDVGALAFEKPVWRLSKNGDARVQKRVAVLGLAVEGEGRRVGNVRRRQGGALFQGDDRYSCF